MMCIYIYICIHIYIYMYVYIYTRVLVLAEYPAKAGISQAISATRKGSLTIHLPQKKLIFGRGFFFKYCPILSKHEKSPKKILRFTTPFTQLWGDFPHLKTQRAAIAFAKKNILQGTVHIIPVISQAPTLGRLKREDSPPRIVAIPKGLSGPRRATGRPYPMGPEMIWRFQDSEKHTQSAKGLKKENLDPQ